MAKVIMDAKKIIDEPIISISLFGLIAIIFFAFVDFNFVYNHSITFKILNYEK